MPKTESPKVLRPKLEKLVKNASRRAKQLKKIPGTKAKAFFTSRLKKVDAKSASNKKLLAQIAKNDKTIAKLYGEMSKGYYATRDRCDGYLSKGEMSDLF